MVNTIFKAFTLSAVFTLSGAKLWAQDSPPAIPPAPTEAPTPDTNATRAERMSTEIAAAITEYSRDMAALQKQIADKDISKEDAERRRKELSKRLEDRLEAIEEMAEAWADNLEESIENLELNLGEDLTLNIKPSGPKKKKFKKKIDGLVMLIGTNQLVGAPIGSNSNDVYSGNWSPEGAMASTFGLYFTNQGRLGRSPLWARSGWGFTAYTYDFGQNLLQFDPPTGGSYELVPSNVDLRRSNLSMTYFELPLSLVINPSRRGKGLSLSAGGFAGIRLGGTRQIVYRSEGMGRVTQNTNGNFYGSLFSYGFQAELGYRRYTVGLRQNLNKPFNEAVLPANIPADSQPNFYNASAFATVRLF
jgi:flagellar motility protein MotE (MotC chaperone)